MHKLTIDFEEWFHPYILRKQIPISAWSKDISRIKYQSRELFRILDESNTKATFFIVGWIVDFFPEIIEEIAANNHHIAMHSYWHQPLFDSNREEFSKDTDKCLNSFYNVLNYYPDFFRAPNFSIRKDTLWALEILAKFGIKHDSSYHFPSIHPDYGAKHIFPIEEFEKYAIQEFPMQTLDIAKCKIPFAGGAYFRYYPLELMNAIFEKFEKDNKFINFYFHPWELDNNLPNVNIPKFQKFRMRYNISSNAQKLEYLLNKFKFEPLNSQRNIWEHDKKQ